MNSKISLSLLLLAMVCMFTTGLLQAADEPAQKTPAASAQTMQQAPDTPLQGIGVVLINAKDNSNVIFLTVLETQDGKQMVGIPLVLDANGKKIVEEYGIMGISDNEKEGMERIQQESQTKTVYIAGMLKPKDGKAKLAITKYGPAADLQKQATAAPQE